MRERFLRWFREWILRLFDGFGTSAVAAIEWCQYGQRIGPLSPPLSRYIPVMKKKRAEGVPSAGSNGPYHAAPPRKERRRKKKLKLVLGSFVVCSARNNCRAIDFQKGFLPRPFPHTYMHHGALRPSRPPFVCVFHVDWKSYTILLLLFSFDSSFYRGG